MISPKIWLNLEGIESVRHKLLVVLFGSYSKPSKSTLVSVRDYLRSRGYTSTYLVEDLRYPEREIEETYPEYIVRKCLTLMRESDVLLFVLLCNTNLEGVTSELTHMCDLLKDRMWRANVYVQEDCEKPISIMTRGLFDMYDSELNVGYFTNEYELNTKSVGRLREYCFKLFQELIARQSTYVTLLTGSSKDEGD